MFEFEFVCWFIALSCFEVGIMFPLQEVLDTSFKSFISESFSIFPEKSQDSDLVVTLSDISENVEFEFSELSNFSNLYGVGSFTDFVSLELSRFVFLFSNFTLFNNNLDSHFLFTVVTFTSAK
jgi:hypothetical protein